MRLRVVLTAAAVVATMTACGGGSDGDLPKLSGTPSATRTTTGTLLDKVPQSPPERPKDVRSKAGALAFSSYAADVVFYVLSTNDVDTLFGIADRELCRTCRNVQTSIERRGDRVQVGDGPHEVSAATVLSQQGSFYTVRQRVKFPSGAEINTKTGKVFEQLSALTQRMNVNLEWRNDAWVLLDYKFVQDKAAA